MNRKFFIITVLLAAIIIISPMLATAEACGHRGHRAKPTVETFTVEAFVDPSTITNMVELMPSKEKFVCHGTIRIATGGQREYDYAGALGTGKLYLETIRTVAKVSGTVEFPPGSGVYTNATGSGGGFYAYTLVIDDGPYGSGTLKGAGRLDWTFDVTVMPPNYEQTEQVTLRPVSGNLDINRVCIEGCANVVYGWWWTTTTVYS